MKTMTPLLWLATVPMIAAIVVLWFIVVYVFSCIVWQ